MALHIDVSWDHVDISGFKDEEYRYDSVEAGYNATADFIWLEMRHEDQSVVYHLTADEVKRIAYELNRLAENM